MPTPTKDEIRQFFTDYIAAWNAHDREAFVSAWKGIASEVTLEDPVGAPIRRGWDQTVFEPWNLMNDTLSMSLKELIICGNEVAFMVDNVVGGGDQSITITSIETMRFDEEGRVWLRTWWEPQGEMLEGYAAGQPVE